MGCFVVTEFLLTTASRGPSAIAEPLVWVNLTSCHGGPARAEPTVAPNAAGDAASDGVVELSADVSADHANGCRLSQPLPPAQRDSCIDRAHCLPPDMQCYAARAQTESLAYYLHKMTTLQTTVQTIKIYYTTSRLQKWIITERRRDMQSHL